MSSETRAFYRAQGPPTTLELALPEVTIDRASANRTLAISRLDVQKFDSDYQIREMANSLGLHKAIGPSPLVEMLLKELALLGQQSLRFLPMKNPMPARSWNFWP